MVVSESCSKEQAGNKVTNVFAGRVTLVRTVN